MNPKAKETVRPVQYVSKPSLVDTLKNLPLGEPRLFSIHDYKTQAARVAISDLRKKKYEFKITEAGAVDSYIVTRLK